MKNNIEKQLRQRLAHNQQYLAQDESTRTYASSLTFGKEMTAEWLRGEAEAIRTENQFIEQLLK